MGSGSLGELELMVLLAALRLGEDRAYAVSIVDEIAERTGRSLQRAAVYTTLQRLEQKGLVSTWLGDPRPERGGKARRQVRVEPAGVEAVRATRAALRRLWDGMEATVPGLEG
ncbi:MAG TPA: helix-turn-helix transcriptional regulator [Thermoanaerobaculia bacterium]|nr:helix-turn-helix transcriptional regulator [Thermoanaerobaculia bacterium]